MITSNRCLSRPVPMKCSGWSLLAVLLLVSFSSIASAEEIVVTRTEDDIDYGLLHELAHQLGIIDIYRLNIPAAANHVSGQGYTAVPGLMRNCAPFLSAHTALGMDRWFEFAHGYYGPT